MNKETGVLVCTEREDEQRGLRILLKSLGYNLLAVTGDAAEASAMARSGKVAVIIIDSGFNGIAMRFIREERRWAVTNKITVQKLIIITDSEDGGEVVGLPSDAAVIGRPYALSEVVRMLDSALGRDALGHDAEGTDPEQNSEQQEELEVRISEVLHSVGIPAHIKGYTYLRRAIAMTVREPDVINFVTRTLYPTVALGCDTTPTRVERAIRHAIEVAWDRGEVEVLDSYFGYTISRQRGKPTNSEFIAMIADKIRLGVIK